MLYAPGEVFDALSRAHRRRWTHSDELLALLLEKLDELTIMFAAAWGDPKKTKARKPFHYPRPNASTQRKKASTPEEIRRFFRGR